MIEERGFSMGHVFTAICLGFIVHLVGCRVDGFACGLIWSALVTITIINHADNVFGDVFFGASKFFLLGSGYLCVFDGCLVHEFLTDGDGTLFEIIVLGKDP